MNSSNSLNLVDGFDAEMADVAAVDVIRVPVERAAVRVAHAPRTDLSQATCQSDTMVYGFGSGSARVRFEFGLAWLWVWFFWGFG